MVFSIYQGLGDAVITNAVAHNYYDATGKKLLVNTQKHLQVFSNSPYIEITTQPADSKIRYKGGYREHAYGNLVSGFTLNLAQQLAIAIPVKYKVPELYFTQELPRLIEGRYTVLCCGWYDKCNTKNIGRVQTQNIVNANPDITFVQAGLVDDKTHQPMLFGNNIISMVNKTASIKDFAALLKYADMVIGPASSFVHVCACYDTPAIVVCGNRQVPDLTTYPCSHHITSKSQCGPCMAFKAFGNINAQGPICRYIANVGQQVIPQCMVFKDIHVKFRELYDKYARK